MQLIKLAGCCRAHQPLNTKAFKTPMEASLNGLFFSLLCYLTMKCHRVVSFSESYIIDTELVFQLQDLECKVHKMETSKMLIKDGLKQPLVF